MVNFFKEWTKLSEFIYTLEPIFSKTFLISFWLKKWAYFVPKKWITEVPNDLIFSKMWEITGIYTQNMTFPKNNFKNVKNYLNLHPKHDFSQILGPTKDQIFPKKKSEFINGLH